MKHMFYSYQGLMGNELSEELRKNTYWNILRVLRRPEHR